MERFEEARRWFLQPLRELRAAEESLRTESYEWSSFQSQQAAEKAVKVSDKPWGASPGAPASSSCLKG